MPLDEETVTVAIKRLRDDRPLPSYGSAGAAALDLRAALDGPLLMAPGASHLVATGLAIHIQQRALVGLIVPRSGLGHKHGIVLGNGTGVIDSDYQGELFVSLWNRSAQPYSIEPDERIAQLLLVPRMTVHWQEVETFAVPSARGCGGFGSSGRG